MTHSHRLHTDPQIAARAVVLQLLCGDHEERWSCAELQAELSDIEPWALARAVERLAHEGIVETVGEHLLASRCARRLDELELVAI